MSNQIVPIQSFLAKPNIDRKLTELLKERKAQFVSTITQISQSGALAKCEPGSVVSAGVTAVCLNLSINPNLGQAHIVPYKDKAQFQVGYKGFIQLALRSGQVKTLNDFIVPAGALRSFNPLSGYLDVDWSVGETPKGKNPDGYGCYFELTNGFRKTVFWSYEKVYQHAKQYSQAFSKGYNTPWNDAFDAMALKTVIKYAANRYMPLSEEMSRAIESDQGTIDIETGEITYVDNTPEVEVAQSTLPELAE